VDNIIPKSREWLIINYVVNATRITLPGFTYLEEKGYMMTKYNFATCMAMQSKAS
jgi:hypothetical protein